MSKGVLVFARNNSQINYCKQAYFLAKRVKEYLNLPTTIVTDSRQFLLLEYPDAEIVFDNIVDIVWDKKDLKQGTVLSSNEKHHQKEFHDGSIISKKLEWKNNLRSTAYEASPYDETLLLDTDIVICNDIFLKCFEQPNDLLMYKESTDLSGFDRGEEFLRVSNTSVDFYWATCVFFRKSLVAETFFGLIKHIQENWKHYTRIFQISNSRFRNDYAFSIATHIMNGYQSGDVIKPMPGKLYYTTDKSLLWKIQGHELLHLLEKFKHSGEYTLMRSKNVNVHVMNKFSLNRCIDEQ